MMKRIVSYLMMVVLTALAAACTYPFNPDLGNYIDRMVIEGDILVGDTTVVSVSHLRPLAAQKHPGVENCKVWVEGEDGSRYESYISNGGEYRVDTKDANPDVRFRLNVIDQQTKKGYVSDWCEVMRPADIDSLTFELDKEQERLKFNISVTASENVKYFRWSFEEDWEYHADYEATRRYVTPQEYQNSIFDPKTGEPIGDPNAIDWMAVYYGTIVPRNEDEIYYYCWGHSTSSDIMIGTTNNLTLDKLIEHNFYSVERTNVRLRDLYCITVVMRTLSRDAYIYWNNIFNNSSDSGDLTAPMPSELRGNITCISDPSEYVIGFINASQIAKVRTYIDNRKYKFYKSTTPTFELEAISPEQYWEYFNYKDYMPLTSMYNPVGGGYIDYWGPVSCGDCRRLGGGKRKPDWWPTNHR